MPSLNFSATCEYRERVNFLINPLTKELP